MTINIPGFYNTQLSLNFQPHDLTSVKVLLVDDNKMNLILAGTILRKWNAIVDTCDKGTDAINLAKQDSYHIILMDIEMPDVDGYEATRQIRKVNSRIPVIALSAHSYEDVGEKMGACGMNDLVTKPIHCEQLWEVISKNLAVL